MKFSLNDLKLACRTVIAPPQEISGEKRREAEEFLIEFRDQSSMFYNLVVWSSLILKL